MLRKNLKQIHSRTDAFQKVTLSTHIEHLHSNLSCVCVCVCLVPWCKVLQANVSLSWWGTFSLSLLETQQSPADGEQREESAAIEKNYEWRHVH